MMSCKQTPKESQRLLLSLVEKQPAANPPPKTYYRRAVFMLALERLREIRETIEQFIRTESHTGKAYRDTQGEVIGRGKGIMPSLSKSFPEVRYWTRGPAALARTIKQAKTPDYFYLLEGAVHQVEGISGEQLALFVKTAPQQQLLELPPVMFPPHTGTRRCKTCRRPHSSHLHRFHLRGSFDKTHPGPVEAKHRKAARKDEDDRLRDEVPF